MLRIYCPFCESNRDEDEFHCVGEAHIKRPERPDELSDQAWGRVPSFSDESKRRASGDLASRSRL